MTRAWRMEAGPHFNYATLDGDGFEQRLGIGVNLKRYLSSSTVFGVGVIHDEGTVPNRNSRTSTARESSST